MNKGKCEHFHIHKWGEPPLEPDENGTIETEPQCKIKKGYNMVLCNGDLDLCELEKIKVPASIKDEKS